MAANILARQRQLVGTTLDWATNDLVIGLGEIAFEKVSATDVKMKVGDGILKFSVLPYVSGQITPATLNQYAKLSGDVFVGDVLVPATNAATPGRAAPTKDYVDLHVLKTSIIPTSAGAADANKIPQLNTLGKIDVSFLSIPGSLNLKGTASITGAAPTGAVQGDYYIVAADGTAALSWTGINGQSIKKGDSVLFDGTNWHAQAQDIDLTSYVLKSGDVMTGALTLPAQTGTGGVAPTVNQAATRGYVDSIAGTAVQRGGDTMTGALTLPAQTGSGATAPTALQAISKAYLDSQLALYATAAALTALTARVAAIETGYLPLTGGALTGALTSSSTIHATGEISSAADIAAYKP